MSQDNEDVNLDIAHSLYATAKQLDPSRPVNTADGVWGATAKLANPQDFRSAGFALNDIPLGDPHQFSVAGAPPVPPGLAPPRYPRGAPRLGPSRPRLRTRGPAASSIPPRSRSPSAARRSRPPRAPGRWPSRPAALARSQT